MRVKEPVTAAEFEQYYDLRWRILCAPWNQPRGIERAADDATSTHLMAIDDSSRLLGIGRLHFNSPGKAQVRFMAVEQDCQRRGIGKTLLGALEAKARSLGAIEVFLNARETALGFYLKNGYESIGAGHILFDSIAHVRMRKRLTP